MLPIRMTPVADAASAQGPTNDPAQPESKRRRTSDPSPTGLLTLPSDLRDLVSTRLAPRDVMRLTAVSKQSRAAFAEPARASVARAVESATKIVLEAQGASLETMDRLLRGPDGIPQLPPHLQADPLAAVAERLGSLAQEVSTLPGPDQHARFSALLDRVQALDEKARGPAFISFAMAVRAVPGLDADARHGAFVGVTNGLKLLAEDDQARFAAALLLGHAINFLPDNTHKEAVQQTVDVLRPMPGTVHEFVLRLPDQQLNPWIKAKLGKAIAEDKAAALSWTFPICREANLTGIKK
jgi:hypothetical protein